MAFTQVATVQEVPPGLAKQVTIHGHTVALVNANGTYHAIEDNCPHRGAPLSEGSVVTDEIICPWHGARFDLKTGQSLSPPAPRGVAVFAVQIAGDAILIDVAE